MAPETRFQVTKSIYLTPHWAEAGALAHQINRLSLLGLAHVSCTAHFPYPWCCVPQLSSCPFSSPLHNCQCSECLSLFCVSEELVALTIIHLSITHLPQPVCSGTSRKASTVSLECSGVPHLTKLTLPGRAHPQLNSLLYLPFLPPDSRSAHLLAVSYAMWSLSLLSYHSLLLVCVLSACVICSLYILVYIHVHKCA